MEWRSRLHLPRPTTAVALTLALIAISVIGGVDEFRVAALTAAAVGAILATRIRATPWVAAGLAVAVALAALAGHGVGASERPGSPGGSKVAKKAKAHRVAD